MALLYNKKTFDQYGLTVPTTWDEFAQQAEKLAQASNGKVKLCNFFPTHAPWFISLAWASGAELFKTEGDSWVQIAQPSRVRESAHLLGWFDKEKARVDHPGL